MVCAGTLVAHEKTSESSATVAVLTPRSTPSIRVQETETRATSIKDLLAAGG